MRNITKNIFESIETVPITPWQTLQRQLDYLLVTKELTKPPIDHPTHAHTVIIGAGPSAQALSQHLARQSNARVLLINGESYLAYQRAQISSCIADGRAIETLFQPHFSTELREQLTVMNGVLATNIDRELNQVTLSTGEVVHYSNLVIATGSKPLQPKVLYDLTKRVCCFRDLANLAEIAQLAPKRVIVLGGGLLGIEAARAVRPFCDEVTIVEHFPHLLPKQLDIVSAARLENLLLENGIGTLANRTIVGAKENDKSIELRFSKGTSIAADLLVYATGIMPNSDLALTAGLAINRGILVNEYGQTSHPNIYAIGECAEYRGECAASLAPCLRQAQTLAHVLLNKDLTTELKPDIFQLKIAARTVVAIGNTRSIDATHWSYSSEHGSYRRVFVENGTIEGAIIFDDASYDFSAFADAVEHRLNVDTNFLERFKTTGILPSERYCDNSTVCYCAQVSKRTLESLQQAHYSYAEIIAQTGASTHCGSCTPRVSEILKSPQKNRSVTLFNLVSIAIIASIIIFYFQLSFPYATHWNSDWRSVDQLWRNNSLRQWTGYGLLTIMSLTAWYGYKRRAARIQRTNPRVSITSHFVFGLILISALFIHTGGNIGSGTNLWLSCTVLGVLLIGLVSGLRWKVAHRTEGNQHKFRFWRTLHWLSLAPIPALLGFHIVKFYYF